MSLVLDASATVAWVLGEEPVADLVALFEQVAREGAQVPSLWRIEVGNVLTVAARRGRMSIAQRDEALRLLSLLPIATDPDTGAEAWSGALRRADRHRLTLYDATYLELAVRRGLALATLDAALAAAARAEGVAVRP